MSNKNDCICAKNTVKYCKRKKRGGSALGEADAVLKQWLRNKSRFADLFNAVIFDGRQVIKPEELE